MISARGERVLTALNLNRGEREYTPPALDHYTDMYYWDTAVVAWLRARFGDHFGAVQELKTLVATQDPESGFIPHMTFAPGGRKYDLERLTFMSRKRSDYTQPPVLPLAALKTYESLISSGNLEVASAFIQEIFPPLVNHLNYFILHRENGQGSHLIGNIHPHETGRDADPTFDKPVGKWRLPTDGKNTPKLVSLANGVLDYTSTLGLNVRLRLSNWDVNKARRIFWVNDVMFNCIYADGLNKTADLARINNHPNEAELFSQKFSVVQEEILSRMWHPKDSMFYALSANGEHIPTVSVSNLFPILLPNINEEQLQKLLDLIEDPDWFGTKFPLPSVPTCSKSYDPNYEEPRIWRGPTWIITNWFISNGLLDQGVRWRKIPELAQRCDRVALHIARQTKELVEQGLFEFYHPETGKPLRTGTIRNFAWSGLGEDLADMVEKRSVILTV